MCTRRLSVSTTNHKTKTNKQIKKKQNGKHISSKYIRSHTWKCHIASHHIVKSIICFDFVSLYIYSSAHLYLLLHFVVIKYPYTVVMCPIKVYIIYTHHILNMLKYFTFTLFHLYLLAYHNLYIYISLLLLISACVMIFSSQT